jgi:hypothetical protein
MRIKQEKAQTGASGISSETHIFHAPTVRLAHQGVVGMDCLVV